MAVVIADLPAPVLDNTIKPTADPKVYQSDNGLIQGEYREVGNQVAVTRESRTVIWTPLDMKYVDALGTEDTIYTVQEVPLEVRANYARFNRIMPDIDDWFLVGNDQVKHNVLVQGFQRDPMPWLVGPIQLCFGGRLQFDADLEVWADGQLQAGPFETAGAIDLRAPDGQAVFTLPAVFAYDSAVERASTGGGYVVATFAPGDLSFYMAVDNDWMVAPNRVYPVVVEPTISTNVSNQGSNVRRIVQASDGTLYAATFSPSATVDLWESTDQGATWTRIGPTLPATLSGYQQYSPALAIDASDNVHMAWVGMGSDYPNRKPRYVKFVKATRTWVWPTQMSLGQGGSYDDDMPSVAVSPDGQKVWVAYYGRDINNYWNIKHTRSFDGGQNWAPGTQISNTSVTSNWPNLIFRNSVLYCAFVEAYSPPGGIVMSSSSDDGATWVRRNNVAPKPPADTSYGSTFAPSIAVDNVGIIHVLWLGFHNNSYYTIDHSFSTDGGATWTTIWDVCSPIATAPKNTQQFFGLTLDTDGFLHLFWSGATNINASATLNHARWNGAAWTDHAVLPSTVGAVYVNSIERVSGIRAHVLYQVGPAEYYLYFSLNHAPNAPTSLDRADFDPTQAADFTWTFTDPDANQGEGHTQQFYQLLIKRASDGVQVYDSGQVISNVSKHTLPAGTLISGQQYQWQVRVWDDLGGVSAYSALASFYASAPPTATITHPATNGETVYNEPRLTVAWSFADTDSGDAQGAYRVRLLNQGGAQLYDSGKKTGAAGSFQIPYTMATATTYQVEVTLWDSHGIQSAAAVRSFVTDFVAPPAPVAVLTADAPGGRLRLSWTNPAPGPDPNQPAAAWNDVYRRKLGETEWIRIAKEQAVDGAYDDYAVASGQVYEYRVEAIAANTALADSAVVSGSVTLPGLWLHDVADPAGTALNVTYYRDRSEDWRPEAALLQFAGRSRPMVEFGEGEDSRFKVSVMLMSAQGSWAQLDALARRRSTICIRDPRGRKLFGALLALPETDEHYGQSVSLELVQTAYEEEV